MKILKFVAETNEGYKEGSMYEFSGNDVDRDEFKIGDNYDYVNCKNRGSTYMIIANPTEIDRLHFGIMTLVQHLKFDITKTYKEIKIQSKEQLIDTFIKMKNLALDSAENEIIGLLVR